MSKKKKTSDFGLFSKSVENFEIIFQVKSIVGEKKIPEIVLKNAAGLVLIYCDFFFFINLIITNDSFVFFVKRFRYDNPTFLLLLSREEIPYFILIDTFC
jgi:hypothetical protein